MKPFALPCVIRRALGVRNKPSSGITELDFQTEGMVAD